MHEGLWLGVDAGTTRTKAVLFDSQGTPVADAVRTVKAHYPQPGWVEQDPNDLVSAVIAAIHEILRDPRRQGHPVHGMGLANQGETVVAWDAKTGQALAPAIVWQCRRTFELCEQLQASGLEPSIQSISGLPIDPYFSSTKMQWLLEEVPAVQDARKAGTLRLSTTDSWILWHLLQDPIYITDVATASRTQLLDLTQGTWSDELLKVFNVQRWELPTIVPNSGVVGVIKPSLAGERIAVSGLAVDQQAALFGHGCHEAGQAKVSYGTGAFLLANAGTKRPEAKGVLPTIAWQLGDERLTYALDGGVFTAGAAIEWLVDVGLLESPEDAGLVAGTPEDEQLVMVPALAGLGAPWWDPTARGIVLGIHRGTRREQIVQAALRGVAHRIDDIVQALDKVGHPLTELRCDGGPSRNPYLMQYQSDITGLKARVTTIEDLAALGVAKMAALAFNFGIENGNGTFVGAYEPARNQLWRDHARHRWGEAVERAGQWSTL